MKSKSAGLFLVLRNEIQETGVADTVQTHENPLTIAPPVTEKTDMVSSSCKVAILLFCFEVLFFLHGNVSGLTSKDLAPRPDLVAVSVPLEKQTSAPMPSVMLDPYLPSKRRVRRGPDPIHNKMLMG